MGKKKAASGGVVVTMATTGAVMLLRKVLAAAWTKVTGKVPPTDLTDPKVTLPETLAWAVATGVIVETVRFAIVRTTMRRSSAVGDTESS
jgi:uncharacterized membrane protein YjfL (UPF0719 family)